MTTEEKTAIRDRCDKATAGPWEAYCRYVYFVGGGEKTEALQWWIVGPRELERRVELSQDDSLFIAAARQDVPALLDALNAADDENCRLVLNHATEVEKLKDKIDAAEAENARLRDELEDLTRRYKYALDR